MWERKGINWFSLRKKLRLLLTLFESKPHIIIIFHLKTIRQKLEKHHVNGSQTCNVQLDSMEYMVFFHFTVLGSKMQKINF